jgi:hypothetical protein
MPYGKIVVIKRGGGDGTEFPLTATCLFGRYGEQSFGEFASRLHYAIFNPLIVIQVECMFIDFTSISLFFGKCNHHLPVFVRIAPNMSRLPDRGLLDLYIYI